MKRTYSTVRVKDKSLKTSSGKLILDTYHCLLELFKGGQGGNVGRERVPEDNAVGKEREFMIVR